MSALQPTETPEEAPKLAKKARWRNLDSIQKVRQALAAVVRKTYDEKLAPDRAQACTAALRALGKVLHDSELEKRMAELERKLNQ